MASDFFPKARDIAQTGGDARTLAIRTDDPLVSYPTFFPSRTLSFSSASAFALSEVFGLLVALF